jgi:hypothetical protein
MFLLNQAILAGSISKCCCRWRFWLCLLELRFRECREDIENDIGWVDVLPVRVDVESEPTSCLPVVVLALDLKILNNQAL